MVDNSCCIDEYTGERNWASQQLWLTCIMMGNEFNDIILCQCKVI